MTSNTSTRTALAIVLAAVTITAFAPGAYAAGQDRGGRHDQMHANRQGPGPMGQFDGMRGGRGGQLLALGCGPNAAERIETGLVKLGYRVDATAEQKSLLDELKTAALAAQATLAETCDAVMPAAAMADGPSDAAAPDADPAADAMAADASPTDRPDLLEMMKSRLKIEEARVAAMNSVLPKFEAFYTSLSDEQKADLQPRRDRWQHRQPGQDGGPHSGARPGMDRNG